MLEQISALFVVVHVTEGQLYESLWKLYNTQTDRVVFVLSSLK